MSNSRREHPRVVTIGLISGVLYVVLYLAQSSIAHAQGAPLGRAALVGWTAVFLLVTGLLFGLFGLVIRLAASGRLDRPEHRLPALGFPVAIVTALVLTPPTLSIDVLTYVAHGYQTRVGENPYARPVKNVASTAMGDELTHRGWLPVHRASPYGPLWTRTEAAVASLTDSVPRQIRYLKAIVAAASLGAAWLIWRILTHISPRDRMLGTVLYLWNPAVIMELAGDGHNDAIAIVFVLLSLLLCVRARSGGSVVAMAAGALVKATAVLVVPFQLVYWFRLRRSGRSITLPLLVGVCAALALAWWAFAPYWFGPRTLAGLREHGEINVTPSTTGALFWMLIRSHSDVIARRLLIGLAGFVLTCSLAIAAASVRDESSLLRASAAIAVVYVLVAPGYWPWYVIMPVALLALVPRGLAVWIVVALSLGARFAAPVDALRIHGLMSWPTEAIVVTVLGLWAPAVALTLVGLWRSRERLGAYWQHLGVLRTFRPSYHS